MSKIAVIGLDGATFKLLDSWMKEGKLPILASMVQNGTSGELKSVIPPLSPSAWPAFYTGKQAGKTGVFAFGNIDKSSSGIESDRLINSSDVKGHPIWTILSDYGYKVGVMNIPVTWPPAPVNGFLITGFFTPPSAELFTHPDSLASELNEYQIDIELEKYGGHMPESGVDRQEILKDQHRITQNRFRNAVNLIKRHQPDFFCINFKGVDVVQHFLWHDRAAILDYLQIIDSYIEELRKLMEPCTVFVISDHGFHSRGDMYFHINTWLEDNGYLVRSKDLKGKGSAGFYDLGMKLIERFRWIRNLVPEKLKRWAITEQIQEQIDWTITKAHSTRWGIYINTNSEVISFEHYEALRNELIKKLENVKDPTSGKRVFQQIWRREDLHTGPYLNKLPDIIFLQAESYKVNPTFRKKHFATRVDSPAQTGSHGADPNGILIIAGKDIHKGKSIDNTQIIDITPTVLHMMDVPIPVDVDGKVLTDIFLPSSSLSNKEICYQEYSSSEGESTNWARAEEEAIKNRLRGLGYIE